MKTTPPKFVSANFKAGLAAVVLTFTGLPTIPVQAAPPAIELYGTLPKTESFKLSPNGEMFAMVFTTGDKRLLAIAKTDGKTLYTGNLGDTKLSNLQWAGDEHVVAFTHSTGSLSLGYDAEYLQALVVNVAKGEARSILNQSVDQINALFGTYGFAQEDGEWYAYAGIVPLEKSRDMKTANFKQGYPNLAKINLKTGRVTTVTGGAYGRRWVLDENGAVVARSEYDDQRRSWKITTPDGEKPIATGTADYDFRVVGLGRTPGTILYASGGPDSRLIELKLDGGGQEDIFPDAGTEFALFTAHAFVARRHRAGRSASDENLRAHVGAALRQHRPRFQRSRLVHQSH